MEHLFCPEHGLPVLVFLASLWPLAKARVVALRARLRQPTNTPPSQES